MIFSILSLSLSASIQEIGMASIPSLAPRIHPATLATESESPVIFTAVCTAFL